ncbi:Crp/Fnr family transcriptional regulator [Pedobacter africanus]|uniref:Crp/Fnr family transcriptional regulator n=1 Tax=Pedobacter africanus TaxID=151894 RepID=UPI00339643BF
MSPICSEVQEEIRNRTRPVLYRQRDVILHYGQVCRYCLFLIRGLVRSTFILDGVEKIVWFMTSGDVVIAVHSWYEQKPSEEQLTALKETVCFAMSWEDVDELERKYPDWLALELALTQRYYRDAIQRTKWQQFTTEGRIQNLEQLYPKLFADVPAKHLANFLGISRETFSRRRSRN